MHNKNLFFKLEGIYFFQDSAMSRSMGITNKRQYLKEHGHGDLLQQLNINITTSARPGSWRLGPCRIAHLH
ncbi:MAG: hypothetical protein U5L96_11680 [Owenweeksia sp.]|nr:hypothetical protein [Owenweeksia sp.]